MPSLAGIAAVYTFQLFGFEPRSANTTGARSSLGIVVHHGDDVDLRRRHRAQRAHADGPPRHRAGDPGALQRRGARTRPTPVTIHGFGAPVAVVAQAVGLRRHQRDSPQGLLAAVFIYWGWDTASASTRSARTRTARPGSPAVLSTFILVAIYVVVAFAAQAVKGADFLDRPTPTTCSRRPARSCSALGRSARVALKLLIIAVLSSAAASCQTTILPAARTALSMAIHRAFPPKLGEVDPAPPHARVLDVALRHRVVRLVRGLVIAQPVSAAATCSRGRSSASA